MPFSKGHNSGFLRHPKGPGEGHCLGELGKTELSWAAASTIAQWLPSGRPEAISLMTLQQER